MIQPLSERIIINNKRIDDWFRRAKGSSQLAARRVNGLSRHKVLPVSTVKNVWIGLCSYFIKGLIQDELEHQVKEYDEWDSTPF